MRSHDESSLVPTMIPLAISFVRSGGIHRGLPPRRVLHLTSHGTFSLWLLKARMPRTYTAACAASAGCISRFGWAGNAAEKFAARGTLRPNLA
jgi:hypothetical protein